MPRSRGRLLSLSIVSGERTLLGLQLLEGLEYSFFKRDTLVGVGMIRCQMNGCEVGGPGFAKRGDESFVGWGEAVVGGDDEHGAGGELWSEAGNVPGCGVGDDLFGEA